MALKEDVQKALDKTRGYLKQDGGDVELVDVTEDGVVKVKLMGACGGSFLHATTTPPAMARRK